MQAGLREIRVIKRLSQWVLAKETGVPQSKISLFENNLICLRVDELEKIAAALGVPVEQIAGAGVIDG